MASLALIVWLSVTSAVLYGRGTTEGMTQWAHAAVQLSCLFAASLQAGYLESGRDSRVRRPSQVLALSAFLTYMVLEHPGPAADAVRLFRTVRDYFLTLT